MLSARRRTSIFGWARDQIRGPAISHEAQLVWLAIVFFVLMSVWWLAEDKRVPDWDTGAHVYLANLIHSELSNGQLAAPFTDFYNWPPLVHLVGALSVFVAGSDPMATILSSNVVFVPLLAFGCFGVGRIAYGPRAGVLAAVVALGSPMFVSTMHEYELDPPQAAMIAVSVWAILASRRFERIGIAAVAGALSALAMLTKETSVVFLVGLLAVVVLRGGWRHWLGLAAFALALASVAGPWYVYHWRELQGLATSFTSAGTGSIAGGYSLMQQPPRLSRSNFAWYGWDLINEQVLAPFALLFLIGTVLALRRILRRRFTADSIEPELLGGLLVSYAGMTYVTYKDARYTLPLLLYVAVLATGWIAHLPHRILRRWLTFGVMALAAIYFVGLSTGTGSDVRIRLPGAEDTGLYQRQLTLYEIDGWIRGAPETDADVPGLMDGLRRAGIRDIELGVGPNPVDFNYWGLVVLADAHGLLVGPASVPVDQQAYLILGAPGLTGPPPCRRLSDGAGIYVIRPPTPGLDYATLRDPSDPRRRYTFLCPGRPLLSAP